MSLQIKLLKRYAPFGKFSFVFLRRTDCENVMGWEKNKKSRQTSPALELQSSKYLFSDF